MKMKKQDFEKYIKEFNHKELFNHFGWVAPKSKLPPIEMDSILFQPEIIAEQSGFGIIACRAKDMPLSSARWKIANKLKKQIHENIIIFTAKTEQVWLYLDGGGHKPVEVKYNNAQDTERLYQRTSGLIFKLAEQDDITIVDVSKRVRDNFAQNTEKVTKKFYDSFKKQHTALLEFIDGIEAKLDKEWYASIMLNRLMFCYFMQRRNFLDNDPNYLRSKLNECKSKLGKGNFYSFYRSFLLVLFQKGFGTYKHSPEVIEMVGEIPYLNGGLFDLHEIEQKYPDINIADEVFENIFDLFDKFEWHLDTRECSSGNEISPDVLGYIFEKYINERAKMGAYYTKEDITDYISRNSILPYLLESTKTAYSASFEPDGIVWTILRDSEDEYIFESVKRGVNLPLPSNIAIGIDAKADSLLERRKDWNQAAPSEYALPTEIWREVIDRRKRYDEISSLIKHGKITQINDFITYNLNIADFVKYLLGTIEDPKFIQEFYKNLCKITILDPTCGSGAFLFAALNILEPLYDVCLNRMSDYLSHDYKGILDKGIRNFFEENLKLVENEIHPNKEYFIYKSIILNNLYGVDIMREATETAKLRLFLKLVSTTSPDYRKENIGIEPLPDIDFNIKPGNTLIGFAKLKDVEDALANPADKQLKDKTMDDIEIFAKAVSRYKQLQLGEGDYKLDEFALAKEDLSKRQAELKKTLDKALRARYYPAVPEESWQSDYMPFHWVAEFYSIIAENKGFDIIIGNPPYVEYSKKNSYQIKNYETEDCGNLYAFVVEKVYQMLKNNGNVGLIIPISFPSTPRMKTLRNYLNKQKGKLYLSNFADRPGTLFSGVHQKTSILISLNKLSTSTKLFTTNFQHWYSKANKNERDILFNTLCYTTNDNGFKNYLKLGNDITKRIFDKINKNCNIVINNKTRTDFSAVLNMRMMLWGKCFLHEKPSNEYKTFYFATEQQRNSFVAHMNSSLFFLYWEIISDCWHITNQELLLFKNLANIIYDDNLSMTVQKLENDLEKKKKYVGTVQTEYEYYHKLSKPIIDEIDKVLAKHYGFTEEELDYIINYDIKYRMGGG